MATPNPCPSCHTCQYGTLPFMPREYDFSPVASSVYHEWVNGEYLKTSRERCQELHGRLVGMFERGEIAKGRAGKGKWWQK